VKGSHKELPQELIDELKAICQVLYITVSLQKLVNCCGWLMMIVLINWAGG
jgi:hypothetical protein